MEYQPNPRSYWLEIDPENGNPTGQVCWAYYPDDRPMVGCWIKVTEEPQTATDLVDEFRAWERTHNRENYGRCDAFKAGFDLRGKESRPATEVRQWWLACDGFDRHYTAYDSYEDAKKNRVMTPIHVSEVIRPDFHPPGCGDPKCDKCRKSYD